MTASMRTAMMQGDTAPSLQITCTDEDEDGVIGPVDLTLASEVLVIGSLPGATDPLFTRVVTPGGGGQVTMTWEAGDTDQVGELYVQVKVTWPGGQWQHFPGDGWLVVDIYPRLD